MSDQKQDIAEVRERRNLGANFEASLLDTGGVVITLDSGSAAILKAEQAYNLLDFLNKHRSLLHQKSQEQVDEETDAQKASVRDWITRSHATTIQNSPDNATLGPGQAGASDDRTSDGL